MDEGLLNPVEIVQSDKMAVNAASRAFDIFTPTLRKRKIMTTTKFCHKGAGIFSRNCKNDKSESSYFVGFYRQSSYSVK